MDTYGLLPISEVIYKACEFSGNLSHATWVRKVHEKRGRTMNLRIASWSLKNKTLSAALTEDNSGEEKAGEPNMPIFK